MLDVIIVLEDDSRIEYENIGSISFENGFVTVVGPDKNELTAYNSNQVKVVMVEDVEEEEV